MSVSSCLYVRPPLCKVTACNVRMPHRHSEETMTFDALNKEVQGRLDKIKSGKDKDEEETLNMPDQAYLDSLDATMEEEPIDEEFKYEDEENEEGVAPDSTAQKEGFFAKMKRKRAEKKKKKAAEKKAQEEADKLNELPVDEDGNIIEDDSEPEEPELSAKEARKKEKEERNKEKAAEKAKEEEENKGLFKGRPSWKQNQWLMVGQEHDKIKTPKDQQDKNQRVKSDQSRYRTKKWQFWKPASPFDKPQRKQKRSYRTYWWQFWKPAPPQ